MLSIPGALQALRRHAWEKKYGGYTGTVASSITGSLAIEWI